MAVAMLRTPSAEDEEIVFCSHQKWLLIKERVLNMVEVKVNKIKANATLPVYMTAGSAGCDVIACLEKPMIVEKGQRVMVPTGLVMEIPVGYEVQVRPRSGLAFKKGLTVVNAPGTIDSDFRGEVMVLLINLGEAPIEIQHGERIAQFVLNKVEQINWTEVEKTSETTRGSGGFGSTGVK